MTYTRELCSFCNFLHSSPTYAVSNCGLKFDSIARNRQDKFQLISRQEEEDISGDNFPGSTVSDSTLAAMILGCLEMFT